jgi:hypothetical protein
MEDRFALSFFLNYSDPPEFEIQTDQIRRKISINGSVCFGNWFFGFGYYLEFGYWDLGF